MKDVKTILRSARNMFLHPFGFDNKQNVIATHHKTGTVLVGKVFQDICRVKRMTWHMGGFETLPSRTAIWIDPHSHGPYQANHDISGIHIVRHPFQMIVSGYHYHLKTYERWCVDVSVPTEADGIIFNFDGLSYQEYLKSLSVEDGLLCEINGRSKYAIMDMYNWNYQDSRFLNIKFEDLMTDFEETFMRIFQHLHFEPDEMDLLLELAGKENINNWSQEKIKNNRHVTNKNKTILNYDSHLHEKHFESIAQIYPKDLLEKIGY